jgi:fatty acid desaturase
LQEGEGNEGAGRLIPTKEGVQGWPPLLILNINDILINSMCKYLIRGDVGMKYYGLSEVDIKDLDAEKMSFYSLTLLFATLAVFFLLIGVGLNFLYGIVLFMLFAISLVFLLYMHGADERNLNQALAGIPSVVYIPARLLSANNILKELDERKKRAEE